MPAYSGVFANGWSGNAAFWDHLLPGTTSSTVPRQLLCPQAKPSANPASYSDFIVSTGMNGSPSQAVSGTADMKVITVAAARPAGEVIAFADGLDWLLLRTAADAYDDVEGLKKANAIAYRHRDRAQAAMYDGHVQGFRRSELVPAASSPFWLPH